MLTKCQLLSIKDTIEIYAETLRLLQKSKL